MGKNRIGENGTSVKGKKASGILFTDGKSMLLLKRAGEGDHIGKWALPGGKAKDGETAIGTAIRETMEETGVESIPGHRFDSLETKNGKQKFTTFFYRISKPFDVTISKEHSDYKWISLNELSSIPLHPKFEKQLPDCLHIIRKKITNFTEWAALTEFIAKLS